MFANGQGLYRADGQAATWLSVADLGQIVVSTPCCTVAKASHVFIGYIAAEGPKSQQLLVI